jgi:hypothetical protein
MVTPPRRWVADEATSPLRRVAEMVTPPRRWRGLLLTQGKQRLFFYMDYYTIALKKLIFTFLIYVFGL